MKNKNADVICKLSAFVHHVLQRQWAPDFVFEPAARSLYCTSKCIENWIENFLFDSIGHVCIFCRSNIGYSFADSNRGLKTCWSTWWKKRVLVKYWKILFWTYAKRVCPLPRSWQLKALLESGWMITRQCWWICPDPPYFYKLTLQHRQLKDNIEIATQKRQRQSCFIHRICLQFQT